MKRTLILAIAILVVACGGPPLENCTQLGYTCGTDDFGHSCGTCSTGYCTSYGRCSGGTTDPCGGLCLTGQVCSGGICVSPTCNTNAYAACTSSSSCCADGNTRTYCTIIDTAGDSFCEPECVTDNDCMRFWRCATRTDGIGVCVPN